MKRSGAITLTLIASVSISLCGCSSQQATKRETYRTKQECVEDWGSGAECEEDKTQQGRYYGPHYIFRSGYPYYFSRGSGNPVAVNHTAGFAKVTEGGRSLRSAGTLSSVHTSRGGFGRSSFFHSSGG